MKRLSTTLLIALAAVLLTAAPALAHVELTASSPQSGAVLSETVDEITLDFSVAAVIAGDGIILYDGNAAPLDADVTQVSDTRVVVVPAAPLADGTYAVTWSMQSGDAHPVTGGIEFSVAIPAAPTTTATAVAAVPTTPAATTTTAPAVAASETAAAQTSGQSLLDSVLDEPGSPIGPLVSTLGRSAAIVAALVGIGALAFGALVLRGSQREAETVGYWMRRSGAVIILATPIVLLGRVLETGTSGLGAIAFGTVLQIAGGIALFAGTRIVTVPEPESASGAGTGGVVTVPLQRFRVGSSPAALTGMTALVLSFALDGHSASLEPGWLMTIGSMVHVVAAAVWVGGVALLGRTLIGRGRRGEPLETGTLVLPFSVIAAIAVTTVGITGLAMAIVIADGIGTLFTTPWGWAMLAKLGLVGVAGAIGAYNHFVLVPILRSDGDNPRASVAIVQGVRVEIIALVVAAAITGALVGLSAT